MGFPSYILDSRDSDHLPTRVVRVRETVDRQVIERLTSAELWRSLMDTDQKAPCTATEPASNKDGTAAWILSESKLLSCSGQKHPRRQIKVNALVDEGIVPLV